MAVNRSKKMTGSVVALLVVCVVSACQTTEIVAGQPQWGSLRGRFVYQGSLPVARFIEPEGENSSFIWSIQQIPDESLIVDPKTHGIKNIVVYAKRVSRVHETYQSSGHSPLEMSIQGCQFRPHLLAMRVDQSLEISNLDPINHTASIQPPLEMGINALLTPGDQSQYSFPHQEGSPVAVFCRLCPWAVAYVLPRSNPYFAVSDAQGKFEIANVPAGEKIEWVVWHESVHQPNWRQEKLPVTLVANAINDVGEIKIPASAFTVD